MNIRSNLIGYLSILAVLGAGAPALAQGITPSHVYQVVDNINGELALLHESNGSKSRTDKKAPALTKRRPRHVIQKAREVLLKVQALRKINGLAAKSVPTLPVREVRPADVKNIVTRVLGDIRELRAKFGVSKPSPAASLTTGKTPTDVYGNLLRTGLQLDGLGIPRIVPNDVHQVALTIISDIEMIRAARGLTKKVAFKGGTKRKKPKHVFQHSFKLMQAIKNLSEKKFDFAVPGGVVLPNNRSGRIKPGHVIDLLNKVLAEIAAIKVKLGVTTPTVLAPAQSGKTPSNVFDAVNTALFMVETLSAPTQG